jgi:hypothetical protein
MVMGTLGACASPEVVGDPSPSRLEPFVEAIPSTSLRLEMIPVHPLVAFSTTIGEHEVGESRSGHDAERGHESKTFLIRGPAFWVSRTGITRELYDAFVYEAATGDAVASTRPSKPGVAVDPGFGHDGYPATSISVKGARALCRWLSAKTGRRYRLPTDSASASCAGPCAGRRPESGARMAGSRVPRHLAGNACGGTPVPIFGPIPRVVGSRARPRLAEIARRMDDVLGRRGARA